MMKIQKSIYVLCGLLALPSLLWAQVKSDTLLSMVPQTHQFFHLQVPAGELFLRSSNECGISTTRLHSVNNEAQFDVQQKTDDNGNFHRHLTLSAPGLTPKSASTTASTSTLRLSDGISTLNAYDNPDQIRSEIQIDPNLSTDLFLHQGVGASRLDLSGLSLTSLTIKSAFSDIMLNYGTANQVQMQKMEIHSTRGDVIIKHPELAMAHHIVIQNDMGTTKLVLGDRAFPHTNITVHSGTGSCVLMVDKEHPTLIIVKAGMFADEEIGGSFDEISEGVYANESLRTHCGVDAESPCQHSTTVTCDLDLGTLTVMENR